MNQNIPEGAFRKQILASLPAIINTFMMGSANGWLPNAIYFYATEGEDNLTSMQYFLMTASSEIGRLGVSIPVGLVIEKLGTKKIILCAGILNFISWLILSLNSSFLVICLVRIILGITVALASMTSLIFIGEIASPQIRGKLTSICQMCSSFGCMSQCIIGIVFSSCRALSYCGLAFSSLFFVTIFWLIETPNHLLSVSKQEQAKESLKRIRPGYAENDIDKEFDQLHKHIAQELLFKRQTQWLHFVTCSAIRKPLITTMLVNLLIPMTGRLVITPYVTVIYPNDGFVPSQYFPLIGELILVLATFSSAFYIDRLPRRTLLMVGNSLLVVITASCAYTHFKWTEHDDKISKSLFLGGNILCTIIFNSCVVPVRNATQSEILPQAVKRFGESMTIFIQAASQILLYQLYRVLDDYFALYYLYVILSANMLILGILLYFRLPEGSEKILADMTESYKVKNNAI